jgi:hypothetical protein
MLLWLDSSEGAPWVAAITGLSKQFGLERDFLAPVDKKKGQSCYQLAENVLYQVQPTDGEERHFLWVDGDMTGTLGTDDAMALVAAMEARKSKVDEEVDAALRRVNFNSEGGFSRN